MFAQTPVIPAPHGPFIILSSVESTNNYAMAKLHAGLIEPETCFLAIEQTAGKGQRGKQWMVNPGENITISTLFSVSHINNGTNRQNIVSFPFLISAAMSLGCYDFIKACGLPDVSIKWPNDVYCGDRKAAGILIENVYKGTRWDWAIIGTGVNLNQTDFHIPGTDPVSVRMITKKVYDVIKMGRILHQHLCSRFQWMQDSIAEKIMSEYNSVLYLKGKEVRLKKGSMAFTTRIDEVTIEGLLVTKDTMQRSFNVGEVEFVTW